MSNILQHPEIKNAGAIARLALVEQLLNSIGDLEITGSFKTELLKRSTELEKKPALGRTWKKVKASRRK